MNVKKVENIEEVEVEVVKKEKKSFKNWVKKHKTGVSVGVTAVVGIGFSALTYKMGYGKGHHDGMSKGYDEGFDNGTDWTIQDLRDSGRLKD